MGFVKRRQSENFVQDQSSSSVERRRSSFATKDAVPFIERGQTKASVVGLSNSFVDRRDASGFIIDSEDIFLERRRIRTETRGWGQQAWGISPWGIGKTTITILGSFVDDIQTPFVERL